jgi:hypothetical protein
MELTISLSPDSEAGLRRKADALGQPLNVYAAHVLEQAAAGAAPGPSDHATMELLRSWNAQDATDDPAELAARQREWEEFAVSINAHHSSSRKIYP